MFFLEVMLLNWMNKMFHRNHKSYCSLEAQWEDFDKKNGITKEDLESTF